MRNRKTLFWLFLATAFTLFYFWGQSRYPQLNQKAVMGGRTSLLGISFDVLWEAHREDPIWKQIIAHTLNWYYTNWKGMLFGLIFASLASSILSLIHLRFTRFKMINAILGTFIGAPMGVCVNCATPIGQSTHDRGRNAEFSLALTSSSPTLNLVVLSILFHSFPNYMVATKIFFTVIFLILVIPLIGKLSSSKEQEDLCSLPSGDAGVGPISLLGGLINALVLFLKNGWALGKKVLPFMLLAGLLGSMIIVFVPAQWLTNFEFGLFSLLALCIVGAFLPVPMSFDVILVAALIQAGLHPALGMGLLFTLGIFSIYPFLLFSKTISLKVSTAMMSATIIFGLLAGLTVNYFEQHKYEMAHAILSGGKKLDDLERKQILIKRARENCHKFVDLKNYHKYEDCVEGIVQYHAEVTSDPNFCDNAPTKVSQKRCRQGIKEKLLSEDINLCKSESDPKKCYEFVMFKRLFSDHEYLNWKCENIAEEVVELCQKVIKVVKVVLNGGDEDCYQFSSNPKLQDSCFSQKSFHHTRKTLRPNSLCQNVVDPAEQQNCRLRARIIHSVRLGDLKHCNLLKGAERESCQYLSIKNSIFYKQNFNICKTAKDSKSYKRCEMQLAIFSIYKKLTEDYLAFIFNDFEKMRSVQENEGLNKKEDTYAKNNQEPYRLMSQEKNVILNSRPHAKRSATGKKLFSKLDAHNFGIKREKWNLDSFDRDGTLGSGLAAGDLNNDGLPDLVIGRSTGLGIYYNQGSYQFKKLNLGEKKVNEKFNLDQIYVFMTNIVDLNNDHQLDIVFSSLIGNYFIMNDGKNFKTSKIEMFPETDHYLSLGSTFVDVDKNGFLDVYFGNWSTQLPPEWNSKSRNRLFLNMGNGVFKDTPMPSFYGETWSVLFSDFNHDRNTDLLVANDFATPDNYYLGTKTGQLELLKKGNPYFPFTGDATMSVDTGDINNDLKLDIFTADFGMSIGRDVQYCELWDNKNDKRECEQVMLTLKHLKNYDLSGCKEMEDDYYKRECMLSIIRYMAIQTADTSICHKIPKQFVNYRHTCIQNIARVRKNYLPKEDDLPQKKRNVLFVNQGNGVFKELAHQFGVSDSGWSWTAKFADLDNDGWQDIYVGNGYTIHSNIASSVFYHNQEGKKFVPAQEKFGLTNYFLTRTFIYVDLDGDGDLDIVNNGILGPLNFFINNGQNNTISFSVRDDQKNTSGIGVKLKIFHGKDKAQLREIKNGGGLAAVEPAVAYFGLGEESVVNKIIVEWPDGTDSIFKGTFKANHHYQIERSQRAPNSLSQR